MDSAPTSSPSTPLSGQMLYRFNSKDEGLAFFKGMYGVNKTLRFNKAYSGAAQVMYTCKDCNNFKLVLTRKQKKELGTWWSLSKTACLEHASSSASGKYPCLGQPTMSTRDIVRDPSLRPLLNQALSVKTITSVIEARGARVTDDRIKKANSLSKISGHDHLQSFNKIEPYLCELRKLNEGLQFKIDRVEDSSYLKRIIIIPHYTRSVLQYMYPTVGLDCAHMKTIVVSHETQRMSRIRSEGEQGKGRCIPSKSKDRVPCPRCSKILKNTGKKHDIVACNNHALRANAKIAND